MPSATKVIKYPAFSEIKLYILSSIFAISSILIPDLLHHFGIAGQMFLPLYFFSLLAGITFGKKCGLLVGVLSPLISFSMTGMPPIAILQFVLFKATFAGVLAGLLVERSNGKNLMFIVLISILLSQLLGSLYIFNFTKNITLTLMDIKTGYIGLLLQLILVPLIAKKLQYGDKTISHNS